VQDNNLPAVIDRGAEDHGGNLKLRREGEGGHTTEAIATASNGIVLVLLMVTLLPGVVVMMVRRDRLLGRSQTKSSMRVAADERQRQ